jgi:hypothetical protein
MYIVGAVCWITNGAAAGWPLADASVQLWLLGYTSIFGGTLFHLGAMCQVRACRGQPTSTLLHLGAMCQVRACRGQPASTPAAGRGACVLPARPPRESPPPRASPRVHNMTPPVPLLCPGWGRLQYWEALNADRKSLFGYHVDEARGLLVASVRRRRHCFAAGPKVYIPVDTAEGAWPCALPGAPVLAGQADAGQGASRPCCASLPAGRSGLALACPGARALRVACSRRSRPLDCWGVRAASPFRARCRLQAPETVWCTGRQRGPALPSRSAQTTAAARRLSGSQMQRSGGR